MKSFDGVSKKFNENVLTCLLLTLELYKTFIYLIFVSDNESRHGKEFSNLIFNVVIKFLGEVNNFFIIYIETYEARLFNRYFHFPLINSYS
ncbi:hypothetical protein BpHYR1_008894 [Brachionus plicatilis]|uniref:Uncharacterized protein n=1 Tax=Brachionus plicatilis TaxID=10195 RepID=A0A3M7PCR1_BRAPC|nr:hypothetical protein BpHYR1_008894 [Brachionus plicatilis]